MKDKVYKKILEDRIDNIMSVLDNMKSRLDTGLIDYFTYLSLESNLYNDLIICRRELIDLENGVLL